MMINSSYNTLFGLNALRERNDAVSLTTEKLSSGLRINHAADDPSGLSVATGMSSRIEGLEASLVNIQSAVSMVQTMEGGLGEIQDMLMRVRDLAVRAANTAVLADADRNKLQDEADSLVQEIDRTAQSVTFNNKYVLAGGGSKPVEDRIMVRGRATLAENFTLQVMDKDGGNIQKISPYTGDERHAIFSNDGSKLAFVSNETGAFDVYVANPDGSDLINLTNSAGSNERVPRWSPDGTKLIFYGDVAGNSDIYVINADGTGLTQISNDPANESEPRWSPDGTKIIYQSEATGDTEIFTMNPDGSGKTNISNHAGFDDRFAAWSPDGSKISYASNFEGNWDIYTANPDGSNLKNVTNDPGMEQLYHWSPDGSKILFKTDRDGNNEVYIMNADGTGQTNLTNTPGASDVLLFNTNPWIDDKTIGFDSSRTGQLTTFLMDVDGGNQRISSGGLLQTSLIGVAPPGQENPQIIQVGSDNGQMEIIELNIPVITSGYLEIASLSFATTSSAGTAITAVDAAIDKISSQRETLGIIENRLRHIADDNSMELMNTYASRSSILDANMATEASAHAKESILKDAATSAISQSKTSSERVLELIRKL